MLATGLALLACGSAESVAAGPAESPGVAPVSTTSSADSKASAQLTGEKSGPEAGVGVPRSRACELLPQPTDAWNVGMKTLHASCLKGDIEACLELGWSLKHGLNGVKDRPAAFPLLECACAKQAAIGCSPWGTMFERGHGVGRDEKTS